MRKDLLSDSKLSSLKNELNQDVSSKDKLETVGKPTLPLEIQGQALMGKMTNETLRADLGRSSWYLLHVMASRYPHDPTKQERDIALGFLNYFSYLYPCGDCAVHFQKHLKKSPPNLDDRDGFEQWLCKTHNIVNKMLGKPIFDCLTVHDQYDCGCGPDLVRYNPEKDRK
ncbi:hypothetical protein BB559_004298 [Furculomyces boomerangus]|uniref:Sulfhydryl oxidase n=2 Tax=Harpellales TaxID=61421 RepID=A0A2T9YFJ5_9FUNG|nr:hypothetical protein BB559_004298 [Furculomyces boomerangus]PVZ98921.1 hypothetical protein BB558_005059 [Smittium angustum]PWA02101.1 hypothetical protein BB558_001763 [Smittium angustum]